jgi:hypothetical protein
MWVDALALALIACLAWVGARRGAAVAGVQLIGLPLAYAGAVAAAFAFGPALGEELGWPEAVGTLVAGSAGLVVVQLLVSAIARALREREEDPAGASQALGLLFGAMRGALFALPLLWLAGLSEGAARLALFPDGERWEVALWGRNLFDEEYIYNFGLDFFGTLIVMRGDPRTYGISLTARY